MKAYIIKIELQDSEPLIWRRVIMPAGATFNRLHDVIQTVTNFQGGYPFDGYHLFSFFLPKTKQLVTNDDDAYEEYQYFKEHKAQHEAEIQNLPLEIQELERRRFNTEVRKPTGLKIDAYIEKYKHIDYLYDFGDNWEFKITLEDTVDDYYFGYPTLLDGAETAPPEDVGGIQSYYEFLEIYRHPKHPDYQEAKQWAESQHFREYDPIWLNNQLKYIAYKKTEWNKINHDNYTIIEDKYRR